MNMFTSSIFCGNITVLNTREHDFCSFTSLKTLYDHYSDLVGPTISSSPRVLTVETTEILGISSGQYPRSVLGIGAVEV